MKEIQFEKKKYQIPQSWDEVTLAMQQKVEENAELSPVLKNVGLISAYSGIPFDVLKKAHLNKVTNLMNHFTFISQDIDKTPITEFEYKGEKYTVISSLVEAQFQDFVSLEEIFKAYQDKKYEALPMMVAILAKKSNETLDDFILEQRADHFKDLPVSIALKLSTFFLQTAQLSQINSKSYSQLQVAVAEKLKEVKSITSKSAGGGVFTRLWRVISRRFVTSLEKRWNSYLTGSVYKDTTTNTKRTFWQSLKRKLKIKPIERRDK